MRRIILFVEIIFLGNVFKRALPLCFVRGEFTLFPKFECFGNENLVEG